MGSGGLSSHTVVAFRDYRPGPHVRRENTPQLSGYVSYLFTTGRRSELTFFLRACCRTSIIHLLIHDDAGDSILIIREESQASSSVDLRVKGCENGTALYSPCSTKHPLTGNVWHPLNWLVWALEAVK
jgi:hypothetical protein